MTPMTSDAVVPALDGASVAGIVPALFGHGDRSWLPEAARDADQVVLLVLDGLGWHALGEHRDHMPTLAAMEGGAITTVAPATTAAALTSVTTGLAPAQHGVLGYRMMVGRDVLNVLRWTTKPGSRPPDPFDVQRHTPFLGREVPVVTRAEYRTTGFTQAHLRGARFVGWQTTATLIELCLRAVEAGERFTYAYYPGVDTVAHEFGLHDRVYTRELAAADELVARLRDALPAGVTLLVTSDHGQVHLEASSWIDLPDVASRCVAMAGDGRFRYCYAKKGEARAVLQIARDALGDRAWVWSRAELLEAGILGTGATGTVPGRIGDVIIAPREAIAITDPDLPTETRLRSGHGSLTANEMLVPLVAARGG
jgi:predicted AlkP superfamily pyrophosphatase or phosphodiesterase